MTLLEAVPALDGLGAVGAGVPLLPAVEALVRHLAVVPGVALGAGVKSVVAGDSSRAKQTLPS